MRAPLCAATLGLLIIPLTGCPLQYLIDELIEANREYDDIPGVKLVARPSYDDLHQAQGVPAYFEFLTATHTDLSRRAIAFDNGLVRVDGPAGQVSEEFSTHVIRGMAWSNDGTRLALIERPSATDFQHILHVRDELLGVVATHTFTSPSLDPTETFAVSWSADDAWIAVSTGLYYGQGHFLSLLYIRSDPGLVIINAADGRQSSHYASDAFFIGARELVLTIPPDDPLGPPPGQRVRVATISEAGDLQIGKYMHGFDFAVGSNARSGVFLALDVFDDCGVVGLCSRVEAAGLRSADGAIERPELDFGTGLGAPGEGSHVIQAE